ncbi:hypothetical protein HYW83_05810 [Candidatus Peregrinibacteria bacterium]|nr:hypothetical protein [Candidatus Peregrinibacteria bacterium]
MNKKTLIIIATLILLALAGFFLWRAYSGENLTVTGGTHEAPAIFSNSSAGV